MNDQEVTQKITQLEKDEMFFQGEVQNFLNQQAEIMRKVDLTTNALHGVRNQLLYYRALNGVATALELVSSFMPERKQTENIGGLSSKNSMVNNVDNLVTKEINRLVTNNELSTLLQPLYKSLDSITLTHRVSNALWVLRKSNKVDSYSPTNKKRDTVWGRVDIFESKGNPKKQFREEYERKSPELLLQG
jgi:hypothetical protein